MFTDSGVCFPKTVLRKKALVECTIGNYFIPNLMKVKRKTHLKALSILRSLLSSFRLFPSLYPNEFNPWGHLALIHILGATINDWHWNRSTTNYVENTEGIFWVRENCSEPLLYNFKLFSPYELKYSGPRNKTTVCTDCTSDISNFFINLWKSLNILNSLSIHEITLYLCKIYEPEIIL